MLKRILANLIGNGLKFNESDPKRVDVWCEEADENRVRVFVRDNGIGIGEEYLGQVFRIFQRLHPPRTHDGTGIGLAIVKKAASAMGGGVRVQSVPGEGSTFIVDLPNTPEAVETGG